jgi:hypothetical protein
MTKIIFFDKIKTVIKNAEFHADLKKTVLKVVEKCTKKRYKQDKFDEHAHETAQKNGKPFFINMS